MPDTVPARSRRRPPPRRPAQPAHPIPPLSFPENLPVSLRREEIAAAIEHNPVVIVCGETGSGKTTQLPKICLALGRGRGAGGAGLIGHTQPRRIAASAVARRVAEEIGSPLGHHVGFKVRFTDSLSPGASVKLMTDGILLAETQNDPLLSAYDTLIIDEAHERSLNIDFLLGYLKELLTKRHDLKVIVTSATIDAQRFATYFGRAEQPAPVIEVSGRLFPVEIRYRPVNAAGRSEDSAAALIEAVDELSRLGTGDILVFLPGEREIRDTTEQLRRHHPAHTQILPLFSRLSAAEQQRVFQTSNARRIVLATNVAETSLTVPGIRYVIDTGTARVKRYSYRNKVEQLRVEPISQAAASQRAGRCGRLADGVCIRLYAQEEFETRPRFTDPEILRSSLAGVILRMKSLGLTDVSEFEFLEPPSGRAIADGYQLLNELHAVDDTNQLTEVGRQLATLPLDPRIARMLLAAKDHDCVAEMLVVAASLSVQDPRERPVDAQSAADTAHRRFADEKSEFMGDVKLWSWYQDQLQEHLSQRRLRDVCRQNFLSPNRLREWHDVHRQLSATVAELGWRINPVAATYEQFHLALLTGLLGNVGLKSDTESHFLGARGIKFSIWPGSSLSKKPGRWVMAAELIDTNRLFARKVAQIDPLWLERVGEHLLKKSWSDPHWEKTAGRVTVMERAMLYGLPVYQQRRVDFARFDGPGARTLLIREGLVNGMREDTFEPRHAAVKAMMAHNQRLIAEIERLEHKSRRPDVLIDEQLIFAIFDQQIPSEICDQRQFEAWYASSVDRSPQLLFLQREELMRHEAKGVTSEAFPRALQMAGTMLALDYQFEPGSSKDGVTLTVPLYALNQVDAAQCEWLVPGMLQDKLQFLLKSLPQRIRRGLVPVSGYVEEFLDRAADRTNRAGLLSAITRDLREFKNLVVAETDFKVETVPIHLEMNFRIVDSSGRQLGSGRNLAALRAQLGIEAQKQFQAAFTAAREKKSAAALGQESPKILQPSNDVADDLAGRAVAQAGLARAGADERFTDWSFARLPEILELQRAGDVMVGYPALVDAGDHCELQVFDDPQEAASIHRAGLRRLFALQMKEPIKFLHRTLGGLHSMALLYTSLGTKEMLYDQIVEVAIDRVCMGEPLPDDAQSFADRVKAGRSRLSLIALEIAKQAELILNEHAALQKKVAAVRHSPSVLADIQSQLKTLVNRDFIRDTPQAHWPHLPRYLRAVSSRIDKFRTEPARDARWLAEIAPLEMRWRKSMVSRRGQVDGKLIDFGWLLQELRVATFAQELRTPMPVSVKRLQKVWDTLHQ